MAEHGQESQRQSLALARRCAQILDERKLQDIKIFDVAASIQITDFFVLGSGLNSRHVRSAGEFLAQELQKEGVRPRGIEGYRGSKWVLIDLTDVVVHLFLAEQRSYYDLELLWGDCPRVEWSAPSREEQRARRLPLP